MPTAQNNVMRREVIKFCETTSLKGVPRVVKSPTRCLRIAWFVVVIISVTLAFWQTGTLLMEYWSYPSVSVMQEVNRLRGLEMPDYIPMEFPAVTLCNNVAFSSDSTQYNDLLNQDQFHATVKNLTEVHKNNALVKRYKHHLLAKGYMEYLGPKGIDQVGHQLENFFIQCQWHIYPKDSVDTELESCSENSIIEPLFLGDLSKCYTIQYNGTSRPIELDVVLYLDGISNTLHKEYDTQDSEDMGSGAKVFLHEADTLPDIFLPTTLPTGHNTAIYRDVSIRVRLPSPHGGCKKDADVPLYTLTGKRLKYTTMSCFEACTVAPVTEKCGCIPYNTLVTLSKNNLKLPVCGTIDPKNFLKSLDSLHCMFSAKSREKLAEHCKVCLTQCVEHFQVVSTSSVAWPDLNKQLGFYNTLIKGQRFEHRFNDTYEAINKISDNISQVMQALRSSKQIEENFLKVHVKAPQNIFPVFVDQEKFTLASLLASLGATLNLYAGITLILVFELVELCYNITHASCQRK